MRILMICNYKSQVGGISGQVDMLKKQLTVDGHIVDIFSTKGSIFHRLLLPWKLNKIAINYDVLHIHCCSGFGFVPAVLGISTGRRLGKRVIVTYHGGGADKFFARHTKLVKTYLTKTDVNIVLNRYLASVFAKYKLFYVVIPNIIDQDKNYYRERALIQPNFICIRAHEKLYNIPCILMAFQKVQREMPEAALTLVGSGSQHQRLKQMSKDLQLHNVRFTGRVDNKDIYQYLDKADIMLSSPKIDNMPVSLLEGMNAGLLVISSNVGGVPYIIKDKENGLLFENGNERQLADSMMWALNNPNETAAITRNGHTSISKYHWTSVKEQLIKIYSSSR